MLRKFVPVVFIFFFINAIVLVARSFLQLHGFSIILLLAGNAFLFLLSFIGFIIQYKNLHSASTNVFLRGIYLSLLIKMFSVIIVTGAYLFETRGKVNKPSLLALMAFYVVYTVVEVKQMILLYRNKKHA